MPTCLRHLDLPRDASAYLCGPALFMDDITSALVDLGFEPGQIRTEAFGAGPAITPGISAGADHRAPPPAGEDGHRTPGDLHP